MIALMNSSQSFSSLKSVDKSADGCICIVLLTHTKMKYLSINEVKDEVILLSG